MCDIRYNIKCVFKMLVLGYMCVFSNKLLMYLFFKEWFLLLYYKVVFFKSEFLMWGFLYVVVFDLDSIFIIEEE